MSVKVDSLCFPMLIIQNDSTSISYTSVCDLGCLNVLRCGQAFVSLLRLFLTWLSEMLVKNYN